PATADRGGSLAVRLELSLALLKAGRLDESLDECKAILAQPQAPAEAMLLLVRVQLAKNLQRPPAERRWEEVQRLLAQVSRGPAGATAEALRAQVLACQE